MTAEPKSPILHLSGGGKPRPRGLAHPGSDAQARPEENRGGDPHTLKNVEREGSLNSLAHPSHGNASSEI